MLRLTGGEFRGRSIHTPPEHQTRPTQSKLRQALFNSIQMIVPDAVVLDLFAGSGALGFEALSRGAARAVFVESSAQACKLIRKNIELLGVEGRAQIVTASALEIERFIQQSPYNIAIADPPYSGAWEEKLLGLPWERILAPEGLFLIEWGKTKSKVDALPENAGNLVKIREKTYGDSVLTSYRRS